MDLGVTFDIDNFQVLCQNNLCPDLRTFVSHHILYVLRLIPIIRQASIIIPSFFFNNFWPVRCTVTIQCHYLCFSREDGSSNINLTWKIKVKVWLKAKGHVRSKWVMLSYLSKWCDQHISPIFIRLPPLAQREVKHMDLTWGQLHILKIWTTWNWNMEIW